MRAAEVLWDIPELSREGLTDDEINKRWALIDNNND